MIILDFVGGVLYYVLLGSVGLLFQLLDLMVNAFTYLLHGTSVVNFSGSGPNFDLENLGLNLDRAFSDSALTTQPADVTERDVVCSVISKLAYETDFKRKQVFQSWIDSKHLPQQPLDDLYRVFTYTSWCTDYVTFRTRGVYRTKAYVLRPTLDSVVICFRGTQPFDLFQWFTDASVVEHPIVYGPQVEKPIYIHRGFLAALGLDATEGHAPPVKSMVFQLVDHVSRLMQNDGVTNVYITGHSLGAALAQQFAYALRCSSAAISNWHPKALDVGRAIQGVYTFGTPRSGNDQFVRTFNEGFKDVITHRVVNNDDVVGRVPFNGVHVHLMASGVTAKFEYRATDTLVYLRADSSKSHGQTVRLGRTSSIADRPDDRLGLAIGLSSLGDHFPASYCDRLSVVWKAATLANDLYEEKVVNGYANGNGHALPNGNSNGVAKAKADNTIPTTDPVSVIKNGLTTALWAYHLFAHFTARPWLRSEKHNSAQSIGLQSGVSEEDVE